MSVNNLEIAAGRYAMLVWANRTKKTEGSNAAELDDLVDRLLNISDDEFEVLSDIIKVHVESTDGISDGA